MANSTIASPPANRDLPAEKVEPLEHAQRIAAHESPRTTKLYVRTQDEILLDEVERYGSKRIRAVEVSVCEFTVHESPSGPSFHSGVLLQRI